MKRVFTAAWLGVLLLFTGCMKDIQKQDIRPADDRHAGNYTLTEKFEITGGPRKGMKGESVYTVNLGRQTERGVINVENFANAYTVQGMWKGDSLYIARQKFPSYEDSVTIIGSGTVTGENLSLHYFSGGPAGQIKCVCTGVRVP